MRPIHASSGSVALLALVAVVASFSVACGGAPDDTTDSASANATAAKVTSLSAGHWELPSGSNPDSVSWVNDVLLESNGTFKGTMGCGLSNCSGHEINVSGGTYAIRGSEVSFTYSAGGSSKITNTFDWKSGTNGEAQLRANDGNKGNDWFPLARLPQVSAGHYEITSDSGDALFWIQDIELKSNGTFTGTMGCGVSNCSGHEFSTNGGTFQITAGQKGTQIQFLYTYDGSRRLPGNDTYLIKDGATAGTFQLQGLGDSTWFTISAK